MVCAREDLMPADFTIVDGDMIMWLPMFGPCLTMGPPMGMTKAGAKKVKATAKKVFTSVVLVPDPTGPQ